MHISIQICINVYKYTYNKHVHELEAGAVIDSKI
jgi:hypothetical protein